MTDAAPRQGAVLVLTLLIVIVLECVVLGTIHLAVLERHLADNAGAALRLRLAAEGGARAGLYLWPPAADSLDPHAPPLRVLDETTADGDRVTAAVQRIAVHDYIIRAEARGAGNRHGLAAAALLVRRPALPRGFDIAAAAISTPGALHAAGSAHITANTGVGCDFTGAALLLTAPDRLTRDAGAVVDGSIDLLDTASSLSSRLDVLFDGVLPPATPVLSILTGDARITGAFTGVILVDGHLTLAPDADIRGLVLVRGTLLVEPGASVRGAVHTSGDTDMAGSATFDACAARDAAAAAALDRPSAHPQRAWLPAY